MASATSDLAPNQAELPRTGRWPRLAFVAAGLVLVFSSAAKGMHLASDPFATGPALLSRGLSVGLVVGELGLGLWLLAGVLPSSARSVAVCCFGLFFAVSLEKAVAGEVSCACFGNLTVTPWLTAALDAGLVVALLVGGVPAAPPAPLRRAGLVGLLGVGLASAVALESPDPGAPPLRAEPAIVDLGTLGRGQRAEADIVLRNPTGREVQISSVTSSCPCLSFHLPWNQVGSGQTAQGTVVLDLSREPDFSGGLLIEVKGFSGEGRTALRFSIRVTVTR
jgi:hypothetical protein